MNDWYEEIGSGGFEAFASLGGKDPVRVFIRWSMHKADNADDDSAIVNYTINHGNMIRNKIGINGNHVISEILSDGNSAKALLCGQIENLQELPKIEFTESLQ